MPTPRSAVLLRIVGSKRGYPLLLAVDRSRCLKYQQHPTLCSNASIHDGLSNVGRICRNLLKREETHFSLGQKHQMFCSMVWTTLKTVVIQLVWYLLIKQLFSSVSVRMMDIYRAALLLQYVFKNQNLPSCFIKTSRYHWRSLSVISFISNCLIVGIQSDQPSSLKTSQRFLFSLLSLKTTPAVWSELHAEVLIYQVTLLSYLSWDMSF